jgi:hypothetical protein
MPAPWTIDPPSIKGSMVGPDVITISNLQPGDICSGIMKILVVLPEPPSPTPKSSSRARAQRRRTW